MLKSFYLLYEGAVTNCTSNPMAEVVAVTLRADPFIPRFISRRKKNMRNFSGFQGFLIIFFS